MSGPQLLLARAWPWLLAALVLAPVLPRGFVLSYDMVFVPDLAFRSDFLGLGTSLPRAVPSDAVVAVLDEALPGDVLQKLVLVAALGLAGAGARRLVPAGSLVAQLVATTVYVWSPFVAERLGIGHWPLLLTYAALPWLYDAARRARTGERTGPALVLWLALASLSPAGGVIAAVFALACVAGRGVDARRRTGLVAAAAAALNAPWVVAGVLHGSGALSDPRGVTAFAAHGEGLLPAPLAVLGLGGIWNAEVVPDSRTGVAAVAHLLFLLALAAFGVRRWREAEPRRDRIGLAVAAGLGVAVALSGALAPDVVGWTVAHVPGAGLVRDGSRFVALLAPLVAALAGCGAATLADRAAAGVAGGAARAAAGRVARIAVGGALALAPIALMPDLALGLAGRLASVAYPSDYAAARDAVAQRQAAGRGGDVLVLPFNSYRLPSWNDGRRTLDPVGRYLTPDYLASDVLYVSGEPIAGEDERAARVGALLESGLGTAELARALAEEGIGWVVLDREAQRMVGDAAPSADLTGLPVVHEGEELVVWELPEPAPSAPSTAAQVAVGAAWVAAGAVILRAAGLAVRGLVRTRRQMTPSS